MTILLKATQVSRNFNVKASKTWFAKPRILRAVNQISLELKTGQTLGLVGESGCGKSTLARMLIGLLPASSGEITFAGQPIQAKRNAHWRAQRRDMQMVYQDPLAALDRRLKIIDQVQEPLVIQNIGDRAAQLAATREALDSVGIGEDLYGRYPHELSGGQRQRVVMARALVLKPQLLVCDEPVSALDLSIQAQVINLLSALQKSRNLAMLFISHDLRVVRHICDDVAVMYLGKIIEQGPAEKILSQPAHPYTAALISAVSHPNGGKGESGEKAPRKRILLTGEPPNPIDVPTGCAFHPRCPSVMARCKTETPAKTMLQGRHSVACHLHKGTAPLVYVPLTNETLLATPNRAAA
ncbi:ABC transporter ATP-binding protein [Zwartia sp.]|uniref:ABC transporter ATP-binding protein n=1 Tax=Zwartia sp. TaxID=2978004 RepID=UPI003BB19E9A